MQLHQNLLPADITPEDIRIKKIIILQGHMREVVSLAGDARSNVPSPLRSLARFALGQAEVIKNLVQIQQKQNEKITKLEKRIDELENLIKPAIKNKAK